MASAKDGFDDLFSEGRSVEEGEEGQQQQVPSQVAVVYRRRRAEESRDVPVISKSDRQPRVSFPKAKRTSWNRSLSTRGRTSICVTVGLGNLPKQSKAEAKKKKKQDFYKKKPGQQNPPDLREQRAYFQEVDAIELFEESPSPKHFGSWAMGTQEKVVVHDLAAIMERWRISKPTCGCQSSGNFFRIVETPLVESVCSEPSDRLSLKAQDSASRSRIAGESDDGQASITSKHINEKLSGNLIEDSIVKSLEALRVTESYQHDDSLDGGDEKDTCPEALKLKKDSLVTRPSLMVEGQNAFTQLLMVCRQTEPLTLSEAFTQFCNPSGIVKIGEGTYGEAFKAGENIFKIVPIDGDSLVNGEIQKRSDEVFEEVLLSLTLNTLRGCDGDACKQNTCTNFIEAKDFRVCQGAYGTSLISAWEKWDAIHGSENDNPNEFSEKQCYIVFILADGGKDLESFILLNFDEAQSLLTQVTAALAVAEVGCEFEHRDLHWGNILVAREETSKLDFTIEGRKMQAKTFGIVISIIDFTLSRINTGEAILFLDLSSDPALFEGPKGDIQFDTYRKMKEVTEECWEGSFPKTNILWLQYLIDILLLKKSFKRTAREAGHLRSFQKRLNLYHSAKDALSDPFFHDILTDQAV